MHFEPVSIKNLFSIEDVEFLRKVIDSENHTKNWLDSQKNRTVKKYSELDSYFSKKLEPIAQKVFNDKTLKSTYSVYLDYNKPTSELPPHLDNNACTYTIDYSLSAKTPWGLIVGDTLYDCPVGDGLAFMGGHDFHARPPMPDPENNRVEVIMFHFAPVDHWYFTEGPDYVYELADAGILPMGDSYHLSPQKIKK
jgi:hypothetical protein